MIKEASFTIASCARALATTVVQPPKTRAAVLLLHGWASHKDEVGDIYKNFAHKLAENDIASLRFDFFGCGESSPQYLADLTVAGMVQDAKSALHYLQHSMSNNDIPIGICGFSLGSVIMGLLLTEYDFKSAVGLSPVINLTHDFGFRFQSLIDIMLTKPANDNNAIEYDLGWRKITVRPDFIRQFSDVNVKLEESWRSYKGACLVIGGESDFSGANVKNFSKITPNTKLFRTEFLSQTDHIFNVLSAQNNQASWVIDEATNWFVQTL